MNDSEFKQAQRSIIKLNKEIQIIKSEIEQHKKRIDFMWDQISLSREDVSSILAHFNDLFSRLEHRINQSRS